MRYAPLMAAGILLAAAPAIAQTPDGASKTEEGDKPSPQKEEDKAEKDSVRKAPDQDAAPATTTPPEASSSTQEAK